VSEDIKFFKDPGDGPAVMGTSQACELNYLLRKFGRYVLLNGESLRTLVNGDVDFRSGLRDVQDAVWVEAQNFHNFFILQIVFPFL